MENTTPGQPALATAVRIQARNLRARIATESFNNRPGNTSEKYRRYANEFKLWCEQHPLFSGERVPELVNSDKLLLFLQSQEGRSSRRSREEDQVVGIKTFEGYVSGITDLYKQQVRRFLL
jgi:hypothetical protein